MLKLKPVFWATVCALVFLSCATFRKSQTFPERISTNAVSGFPSGEAGYGLGVSACYAGVLGDWLIMAGGCNFPEPGNKKYYSGIYAAKADGDGLDWKLVGHLPEPAAYGGTVVVEDALWLIGGCNRDRSLRNVWRIRLNESKDSVWLDSLEQLPFSVDNVAVASDGSRVYVYGGNQDGKPSSALWAHDIGKEDIWQKLSVTPGNPRVQPVCLAADGKVLVWGGFFSDGLQSDVATSGYCYDVSEDKWSLLHAPRNRQGQELTLSGGIGVSLSDVGYFMCLGGVNKDIFWDAISGSYQKVSREDYLKKPVSWYQFNGDLLLYNIKKGEWEQVKVSDARLARAGAQLVRVGNKCFYIGGELKPSVRTPEILQINYE